LEGFSNKAIIVLAAKATTAGSTSPSRFIGDHVRQFRKQFVTSLVVMIALGIGLPELKRPAFRPYQSQPSVPLENIDLVQLPLTFEKNLGQFDPGVRFRARSDNYDIALTRAGTTIEFTDSDLKRTQLRIELANAHSTLSIIGVGALSSRTNYLKRRRDQGDSLTDVPQYERVKYEAVYSGIDLLFYGNQRNLEYDFVVQPGSDPGQIDLIFESDELLQTGQNNGELVFKTSAGEFRQSKPVIYQESNGERHLISGRYQIKETVNNKSGLDPDKTRLHVGFEIGPYDPSKSLVIDPVLTYSTYLGGNSADEIHGVAVGSDGCAYVVGHTLSLDFPISQTIQPPTTRTSTTTDIFIAKLNQSGTALIYSTYLGGSGSDQALDIAVDSSGNVYVTGFTSSCDFPTTTGAAHPQCHGGDDAFLAKLNAEGTALVYSTYLGGSGFDRGAALDVDDSGCAYVTGKTTSFDFPVTNSAFQRGLRGLEDAFVAKFNQSGSMLVYASYLGGSSNLDVANDVVVDSEGQAHVTGGTASTDFPVTAGALQRSFGGGDSFLGDAFVTKIDASGSQLLMSTYLGGADGDEARAIAVDSPGNLYVAGITRSTNFPTHMAVQSTNGGPCIDSFSNCTDAFVTKIGSDGSSLVYSTYLGGASRSTTPFAAGDSASAIAVDLAGNASVTGATTSTDFPLWQPTQVSLGGHGDAFVTRISPDGASISYSSYFGGPGDEGASDLAVDSANNLYVVGIATSPAFPTTPSAFQPEFGGSFETLSLASDGFILRLTSDLPNITSVSVDRKKLFVTGERFAPGAELFIDGKKQKKTFNDNQDPSALLIAKKSGKKARPGKTITLVVRNPDGAASPPFQFSR
jgi:hypothetical protein